MSKRSRSFDENHEPQYKIRVLEKHVTESSKKSMEIIWNKTLNLLFDGAKRSTDKQSTESSGTCYRCHVGNLNLDACSFCSHSFCGICLTVCPHCHELFCSSCSVLVYGENFSEAVCLSCLK